MVLAYELDSTHYYARILDPRTYEAVTQDILARYLHPLVLESKLLCPKSHYTYSTINKYFDSGVKLNIEATVGSNCVIGQNTEIGMNTQIERSTIGNECKIGKNVKIKNSIIWNNVTIEDGAEIIQSIICDKVIISKNVKVH